MAVGCLLQRFPVGSRIGWIEAESFDSMGRLGVYASVPANAKNKWLVEAFSRIDAFDFDRCQQQRVERDGQALVSCPPEGTCSIQFSIDALKDASLAMRSSGRLAFVRGHCRARCLEFDGVSWNVTCDDIDVAARRVLIAPGATPKPVPTELQREIENCAIDLLHHDDVVCPARCVDRIVTNYKKVGVVGGGHSGLLAAKNLVEQGVEEVVVYARDMPRFAEDRGTWIKFAGSGLRGEVAAWTKENVTTSPSLKFRSSAPKKDPTPGSQAERELLRMFLEDNINAVVFTWCVHAAERARHVRAGVSSVSPYPNASTSAIPSKSTPTTGATVGSRLDCTASASRFPSILPTPRATPSLSSASCSPSWNILTPSSMLRSSPSLKTSNSRTRQAMLCEFSHPLASPDEAATILPRASNPTFSSNLCALVRLGSPHVEVPSSSKS